MIEPGTDVNLNGIIDEDEGDFVRIFIGMRRGGDNIYAIDATPTTTLVAADVDDTNDVRPVFMWRIEGGGTEYPRLGQTWSKPRFTKIRYGTTNAGESTVRSVLVFAGGYDEVQDSGFTASGQGNAIYIVDPTDGTRLFVVSGASHGGSDEVVVPGMDYPIPSDVALMDSDGDGTTDRILVGDTGGQLWRVELAPNLAASEEGVEAVVGELATVSGSTDDADKRKFFYPPDVVRVPAGYYGNTSAYDMMVAVTGNRSHPLDQSVQDRIYALRTPTYAFTDANSDGLADALTTLQGALVDPATSGDLLDVTDVIDFTEQQNYDDLQDAEGWYIDLEDAGEKSLAVPVIIAGQLFATSYLPEGVINPQSCSIAEGQGLLYGINVLNGAPVNNWDGTGSPSELTKPDRVYALGGGIPSAAVPIFQEEGITLLIGGSAGATSVDPEITLPRERTFWSQQDS